MKAKKIVAILVVYIVFAFCAMKGIMVYHDHKEAQLVGEFCQTIGYDKDEVYVSYYKGSIAWCLKGSSGVVEKVTGDNSTHRDMLGRFEANERMPSIAIFIVVAIGAICIGRIAIKASE